MATIKKIGYESLVTVEMLYEKGKFYFMEMNARVQIEHTITERVTGIDLIKQQIKIAAGQNIKFNQKDIKNSGHSIQCRINAEDPLTFIPSPGRIREYHAPGGPGVRVDSALYAGCIIPHQYDNLISKVISSGLLENNKGVHLLNRKINLDPLTEKDLVAISLHSRTICCIINVKEPKVANIN